MKMALKHMAMLLIVATSLAFVSCGGRSNDEQDLQYSKPQAVNNTSSDISSSSSYIQSSSNDYVFADGGGKVYTLTINDDETVVMIGNGNTFYGSYYYYDGEYDISFSSPKPKFTSNGIITTDYSDFEGFFEPVMIGNVLFFSLSDARARNPHHGFLIHHKY